MKGGREVKREEASEGERERRRRGKDTAGESRGRKPCCQTEANEAARLREGGREACETAGEGGSKGGRKQSVGERERPEGHRVEGRGRELPTETAERGSLREGGKGGWEKERGGGAEAVRK